ncbi:MAG: UDP-N-acetylmuramoylalanine--D-glutamate ligase [Verrucomicrobia bacterium GWF2_51_19]|nr:MAG: UDP-N-acetylmuramoylalanine--D-glutamate ligase [Verrucomicrobia bacterium GWF2_51_19]
MACKKTAILGNGCTGKAVATWLSERGSDFDVFDENGRNDFAEVAKDFDTVVCSPGFRKTHPWRSAAEAAGCRCLGELELARPHWKGKVIAVTGTNGKTSLVEFLAFALKRAGIDAHAVGNNGIPFIGICETGTANSIAVCEVSSFQSESMTAFPIDILLWTNFAEDHIKYHGSLEAYLEAKRRLVDFAKVVFIGDDITRESLYIHELQNVRHGQNGSIARPEERGRQEPTDVGDLARTTRTQLENILTMSYPKDFWTDFRKETFDLAWNAWQELGLPLATLMEAGEAFTFPPFRLEEHNVHGVRIFNDSKATNFDALIAALRNLDGSYWIGGGYDKGEDLANIAPLLNQKVKKAYLVGDTAEKIAAVLDVPSVVLSRLEIAIEAALADAKPGETILFSPGYPSFDQFQNFEERGRFFNKCLNSCRFVLNK